MYARSFVFELLAGVFCCFLFFFGVWVSFDIKNLSAALRSLATTKHL